MKPIFLVLLVATSALAVPVVINEYSQNELPRSRDDGSIGSAVARALERIDGGDVSVAILNIEETIKDIANQGNPKALGQILGVLLLTSTGIPGDTCASGDLINRYVNGVRTGNLAGFRDTLVNYFSYVGSKLGLINQLVTNPQSLRDVVGPKLNCAGAGTNYNFEDAWNLIRSTDDSQASYDQYCAAKRLFTGVDKRGNNVGTMMTALALAPVVRVFSETAGIVQDVLGGIANGQDVSGAINALGGALVNAASRIQI